MNVTADDLQSEAQEQAMPSLGAALGDLMRHPFDALVAGFNWKTAAVSAILRATMFFCTNRRSGHELALRATLVEAIYAICSMGLFGAVTERIRNARPAWLTGIVVWIAIPATMLTVQFFVHRACGTPQLKTSMIASFCFAAMGTGFSWFAMRRGALLVGDPSVGAERRTFASDMRTVPALVWEFVAAGPRALLRRCV